MTSSTLSKRISVGPRPADEARVLRHRKRRGVHAVLFTIRRGTVLVLTVRRSAQRSLAEELGEDEPDEGAEPVH